MPPKILPTLPKELRLWRLKVSCSIIRNGWDVRLAAQIPSTDEVWLLGGVILVFGQSSSSTCNFWRISLNFFLPVWPTGLVWGSTWNLSKSSVSRTNFWKTKHTKLFSSLTVLVVSFVLSFCSTAATLGSEFALCFRLSFEGFLFFLQCKQTFCKHYYLTGCENLDS